jgi:hypothetical protein
MRQMAIPIMDMGMDKRMATAIKDPAQVILCLALLTILFPQLLSGNMLEAALARPAVMLFFAFACGLTSLAVREWAARLNIGAGGNFPAGMAHGRVNEGPFAKAIFREASLPINVFEHCGFAALASLWIRLLRRSGWQHVSAPGRVAPGWRARMTASSWIFAAHHSLPHAAPGACFIGPLLWLCTGAERRKAG